MLRTVALIVFAQVSRVWALQHLLNTIVFDQAKFSDHSEVVKTNADAAPLRKPVTFMHIHKSAGTSMNIQAARMGERIVSPSTFAGSDAFKDWMTAGGSLHDDVLWHYTSTTCADRLSMFNNTFTWNSCERQLEHGDLCFGEFVYATILRETIARIESQVNFQGPLNYRDIVGCWEDPACSSVRLEGNLDGGADGFSWLYFDNYVVRSLGGSDTMSLPLGGMNASHLSNAISVLNQFDLVLPLDELDSEHAHAEMDRVLGWHPVEQVKARASNHSIQFSQEDVQRLRAMNKLDVALYDYFSAKFKRGST